MARAVSDEQLSREILKTVTTASEDGNNAEAMRVPSLS
jgi:hypothetical protein